MNSETSRFTEEVDVLDLLIDILREHEKKLDAIVTRLEDVKLTSGEVT